MIYRFLASIFIVAAPIYVIAQSNETVFTNIYNAGGWDKNENGEGTSGTGSSPKYAKPYMEFLQNFLKEKNIKSVVDLGCGDWQFSKFIDWTGIKYIGIDVVEKVIENNRKNYSSSTISFLKMDATKKSLPKADLLICKEVLQHLQIKQIFKIIPQFKKFKYCLITNDVDPETLTAENKDIPKGHYRTLDLTKPPYNLKGMKVLTYPSVIETKQVLLIVNN